MQSNTKWQHKCFESSFVSMNHLINLGYEPYIVHGKCKVSNELMAHSWVELKDKDFKHQVYDLTLCETTWIEKSDFYRYWDVQETCIYNKDEIESYLNQNDLMLGSKSFFKECYFHKDYF